MDPHVKDAVHEMTRASDEERMLFPEIVGTLMQAGIERYHADLVASTKTYFLPDGTFETVPCHAAGPIAQAFSAAEVEAAVHASQTRAIGYGEFCRRVAAAGCVGYFVSLTGRRALYYGRTAEVHVEHFPSR